MLRPELDQALAWAAAEGWNPGLCDAEPFWAADPEGYFLGLLSGSPVAALSAVRYAACASARFGHDGPAPAFAFIGLYLVLPEHRGRGFGLRLWNDVLAGLEQVPVIGLDGVLAQQDNYRKSGFALAQRNCRYECAAPGGAMPPGVRPLSDFPFEAVLALDRCGFPARREAFLRVWVSGPGHIALGMERGGRLAGYGVIRPCGVGSKIGPLFAEDDATAHALFHGLCASVPAGSGPAYLDVPMSHAGAVRLAESHGLRPVFETARMYRGPAPELDLGRVFGITTFELG
jgi:GNAT superfamily N-acetyltransferase